MSIIYDALNKVEKNGAAKNAENKENKKQPLDFKMYLLYVLILVLGIIGTKAILSFISGPTESVKVAPVKALSNAAKPVSKTPLPVAALVVSPIANSAAVAGNVTTSTIAVTPTETKAIEPPALVLNGIFVSPEEKYALINNNIVREGDEVEGAKVLSILENKVEMDFQGLKFDLTSAGK